MQARTQLRRFGSRIHLPGRTVRARLTWLYGSLLLGSGVVLLVITAVLWEHATGPVSVNSKAAIARRFLSAAGFASGGQVTGRPVSSAVPEAHPANPGAFLQVVNGQLRTVVTQQQSSDLHDLLLYSGVALAIMAILAIALGHFAAGRALRPLRAMTETARRISATNLHRRLALPGPPDEVKSLADTIDDLLGRLEQSFESQRQFVANASHELRTPLATMRAMLDVAVSKPEPPPAETVRLAERVRLELDRTDQLVESFLHLARAEGGPLTDGEHVDLDGLVAASLDAHAGTFERRAMAVSYEGVPDAIVAGHRALLSRMVDNLVDNAVAHNRPASGWLAVRLSLEGGVARLCVENSGAVLDDATAVQLVRPFRRAGADRTGTGQGFGLGLSIVAAVVATHGGRLELHPVEQGGLRVVVELPIAARVAVGAGA